MVTVSVNSLVSVSTTLLRPVAHRMHTVCYSKQAIVSVNVVNFSLSICHVQLLCVM